MVTYEIVKFSEIRRSSRLDAEYLAHPKKQWLIGLMKKFNFVPLKSLLSYLSSGHTPYRHDMITGEVKFITVECIDDLFLNVPKLKRIKKAQFDKEFQKNRIVKRSIVCTIKRRICKTYPFLFDVNASMAMNQDVAFLVPKLTVNSAYLSVYLSCKIGQTFADRQKTEQMNPYISVQNLASLPVILTSSEFQSKIERLLVNGYRMFNQSDTLIKEAEKILLSELGLFDWQPKHTLTWVKQSSEIIKSQRVDADHFQPKYEEIKECIRNYKYGYTRLIDIAPNSTEVIDPHTKSDFDYIELSNINQSIGIIDSPDRIKGKDAPSRARMLLRCGDILASTVEGSIDKVAIVSQEFDEAIGSTGFFVLRPRITENFYLLLLVKSLVVREQMLKLASGTILTAVSGKSIGSIIVPTLLKELRKEIDDLVKESHSARREAKALLEKAKRAVEIAIEESEEKAINFLEQP